MPLSKWVLHGLWSCASAFNFHYRVFTLKSRSSYLRLRPPLPFTSILPCIFPSITCFRRQFLCKMLSIQVAFLIFIVCRSFLSSLTITFLHFSRNRSSWSSPSFSTTTFLNFPGFSDLLSEVSSFQHHTKLCSKLSTSVVCSLNVSPVWWQKESSCWLPLLPCHSWI